MTFTFFGGRRNLIAKSYNPFKERSCVKVIM